MDTTLKVFIYQKHPNRQGSFKDGGALDAWFWSLRIAVIKEQPLKSPIARPLY
jgi:hypothetical protein